MRFNASNGLFTRFLTGKVKLFVEIKEKHACRNKRKLEMAANRVGPKRGLIAYHVTDTDYLANNNFSLMRHYEYGFTLNGPHRAIL